VRKVGSTKPLHLRVEIGKITSLQQWIVAKVDTLNDVVGAESDLLGFREEVIDAAIQDQASYSANGYLFLGDQFRRIQNIELKFIGKLVIEELKAQLPFRVVACLNGIPKIAPMKIGIRAIDLNRLVPDYRLQSEFRLPVELYEG
jgi:hypothetical protein